MCVPSLEEILNTADGLTSPIPTNDDIGALREEIEQLQEENRQFKVRSDELWIERCQLAATEAVCDELHELLDLYKVDGTIHDLDQHKPETMQSTLASVLCELMHRLQKAEAAIHETINENNHLADGDNCTLRKLVAHVKQFPGQA